MIDMKNRIVQYPHRYQLTPVAGQANVYDITPKPGYVTEEGTIIDRTLLMAMQGFIAQDTVFNEDGSITETNSKGEELLTEFNLDGSITETFTADGVSIAKQTVFEEDGSITEVIL